MLHPGTSALTMCGAENWFGFFTPFHSQAKRDLKHGKTLQPTNILVAPTHGRVLVWTKNAEYFSHQLDLFPSTSMEEKEKALICLVIVSLPLMRPRENTFGTFKQSITMCGTKICQRLPH